MRGVKIFMTRKGSSQQMFHRKRSRYKNIKILVNEKVLVINHFFDGKILGKKLFCDGDVLDNNNVVTRMISSTIKYTTATERLRLRP